MTTIRLSEPDYKNSQIRLWADEQIWGHRFYDDQTPWLVVLEFLNVFRSRAQLGLALNERVADSHHESIQYDMLRHEAVRRIIFNNPYLLEVRQRVQSDGERWKAWLAYVGDDFNYLEKRFNSFDEFCRVVEFFQGTAVELNSNKRWTSRFVYPYGPNCLYADLDGNGKGGSLGSNDRRFFARSGELLYLMFNRSKHRAELASKISSKLLNPQNQWNRLLTTLQPETNLVNESRLQNVDIGYLPYLSHPAYDRLAEDWLAMLALPLPSESLLDPLVRISGLNLILYILASGVAAQRNEDPTEVANSINSRPKLVLDISSPKRGIVFELSRENYDANREVPARALRARLSRVIQSPEWQALEKKAEPVTAAIDVLQREFQWRRSKDAAPPATITAVWEELIADAEKRHNQHFAKILPNWSRHIGLSLARRGIGTWYAPNDALLKAIVLANVRDREEFHLFLKRLYERYGMVIGPAEAERAFEIPVDRQAFAENAARLELRLRALGLLQRLSDDCAYVRNPFIGGNS